MFRGGVGSGGFFDRDLVAHGFELLDETGLAGGAATPLVEIVAAQIAVNLPGR